MQGEIAVGANLFALFSRLPVLQGLAVVIMSSYVNLESAARKTCVR
jgi:hypothetical protein